MKKSSTGTNSSRRVITFAILGAGLLIAIGSLIALNQIGITPTVLAGKINEAVSRLAGANLLIKADQTTLPADGKTTTKIYATVSNSFLPIVAKIISGGGAVELTANTPGEAVFTYTTGTVIGNVLINITSGSLIQEINLELKDAVVPTTPTIIAPTNGNTTNNPKPEISGIGPAKTKLLITDNGNINTTTNTDDKGNFRVILNQPLYGGKHTLAAVAVSELGVMSQVSNLVVLTVQTEPIKIDTAHIRTSPSRPIAGGSFGLFVPASLNTVKMTVELQGKTYELHDLHKTSIFTVTLPAPEQAGVISANLVAFDAGNNATRFDKVISIVVVSN